MQPAFNTRELDEREKSVLQHFSMPDVIYIGSNEGCGCSFRHALYDKGEWTYIAWEEGEQAVASQVDHQALGNYLKASNMQKFQIYGCWDGDQALPSEYEETISLNDLMQPNFFFRERAHYRITISS